MEVRGDRGNPDPSRAGAPCHSRRRGVRSRIASDAEVPIPIRSAGPVDRRAQGAFFLRLLRHLYDRHRTVFSALLSRFLRQQLFCLHFLLRKVLVEQRCGLRQPTCFAQFYECAVTGEPLGGKTVMSLARSEEGEEEHHPPNRNDRDVMPKAMGAGSGRRSGRGPTNPRIVLVLAIARRPRHKKVSASA